MADKGIIPEHVSVMLKEAIDALNIKPDGTYVDATSGFGGHASEIARRLGEGGRLICIDRDDTAIAACRAKLSAITDKFTLVKSNYEFLGNVLDDLGIDAVDGVLFDLGVSSPQIDTPERGFSYMIDDAPLDMRMDRSQALTAADVVNTYSENRLADIIRSYGEDKFARQIARQIVERRAKSPLTTTGDLVDVIRKAIPIKAQKTEAQPAKRTFQAIRIEVNKELDSIVPALEEAIKRLRPTGRICVISFHSLEDKLVKSTFRKFATGCVCPPDLPICVCGKKPVIRTFKDITPTPEEIAANPRARSARLRFAEKLDTSSQSG